MKLGDFLLPATLYELKERKAILDLSDILFVRVTLQTNVGMKVNVLQVSQSLGMCYTAQNNKAIVMLAILMLFCSAAPNIA